MKKFLISVGFALTSFFSIAQQIQIEDTPPNWTLMLSNLNQSQITSGVLIDKVTDFSKLINFNIGTNNI